MERKESLSGPDLIVRGVLEKLTNLLKPPTPKTEEETSQKLEQFSKYFNDLSEGVSDELGSAVEAFAIESNAPAWNEAKSLLKSVAGAAKKFSVAVHELRDSIKFDHRESEEWKAVGRLKDNMVKDLAARAKGLKSDAETPHKEAFDLTVSLLKSCCDDLVRVAEGLAASCKTSMEPDQNGPGLKRSSITRRSRDCALSKGKPIN